MRTTAIFSYKGGTAKTTTAINLGAELAARGKRVLLVDADGQRNLSAFFGADMNSGTIYNLLAAEDPYCENYIQPTKYENLSVLSSSEELATIELQAVTGSREGLNLRALSDFCESLAGADETDFVIIDCPPSFAPQSVAALLAADDVIVPVTLDNFAMAGLRDLAVSVEGTRKSNPRLRIVGALVTMDDKSAVSRDAKEALRNSGYPVFTQTIRDSALFARASFYQEPLLVRYPNTNPRMDYEKLCDEYIKAIGR